jgi:Phage capsid family
MSVYAARLRTEMEPLRDQLKELRDLPNLTDEQKAEMKSLAGKLDGQIKTYDDFMASYQQASELEQKADGLRDAPLTARARYDGPVKDGLPAADETKSLSDYVTESREFKSPRNGQYNVQESVPASVFYPFLEQKAAFVPGNLAHAHGNVRIISPLEAGITFPLLAFLRTVPWNDLTVPYLPLTFTNNAREQAFAEQKVESTNAGSIATIQMTTIAHWKDVPRQVLRYLPGLRAIIDSEMRTGVLSKVQQRIIAGTGTVVAPATAPQMLGILGQVTQTVGATPTTLTGQIFSAIGIVEGNGGTVDAILMNPGDYAALIGAEYTANKFNPLIQGERFGQYRIIRLASIATGTALVGDFSSSTTVYVGEEATVRASEALGFKSNVVTILGEMDSVVLVERPWLLCKCAGTLA